MQSARTSTAITLSVWKALFLRETLSHLFAGRAFWFWLLAGPMFYFGFLTFIDTVIRVKTVGGIETAIWLMAGRHSYFR
ncbi:hypothetical protein ACFQAT_05830 [Undibacterium arcticum]|uniref:ABC transporter permease n=1 Tax=Undibacterium arcticum TaxID=1762892 RepID=A0ABV7F7W8_9BURK